ncbi:MAG: hypothetical protein GX221_01725 [Candidatus Riflebacteria bacterium]|nr:hypothetical protein [Candidatus Riflebacteria bacterium]
MKKEWLSRKGFAALFLLGFFYTLLYTTESGMKPLGMAPVLDTAENVRLAEQIVDGSLPSESFFRSMQYPFMLAFMSKITGCRGNSLFVLARNLGVFFHVGIAVLAAIASFMLWGKKGAFMTLFLCLFYPPLLFFAIDAFDIAPATFFLVASFTLWLAAFRTQKPKYLFYGAFLLGVAALLRSSVLPFGIIFTLILFICPASFGKRLKLCVISCFLCCMPLLFGGLCSAAYSGEFRLLPWQGSSNLYCANKIGANGKYFSNNSNLKLKSSYGMNPMRTETDYIFKQKTGLDAASAIDEYSAFWKNKLKEEIKAKPEVFIKLCIKKIYYLFNNFEQHNNKTFSFHKKRSPVLRYNPLSFGFIFVLLILSLSFSTVYGLRQRKILGSLLFGLAFLAAGVLMFYVSARFRIIMLPFMIIAASGIATIPPKTLLRSRKLILIAIASFLTFSSFADANSTETYVTDKRLLAHVSLKSQNYAESRYWAEEVLKELPENYEARWLKLSAFCNLVLSGEFPPIEEYEGLGEDFKLLKKSGLPFENLAVLEGCWLWKFEKNHKKARNIWKNTEDPYNDLILKAMLILTGTKKEALEIAKPLDAGVNPILDYAFFKRGFMESYSEKLFILYEKVFAYLLY